MTLSLSEWVSDFWFWNIRQAIDWNLWPAINVNKIFETIFDNFELFWNFFGPKIKCPGVPVWVQGGRNMGNVQIDCSTFSTMLSSLTDWWTETGASDAIASKNWTVELKALLAAVLSWYLFSYRIFLSKIAWLLLKKRALHHVSGSISVSQSFHMSPFVFVKCLIFWLLMKIWKPQRKWLNSISHTNFVGHWFLTILSYVNFSEVT